MLLSHQLVSLDQIFPDAKDRFFVSKASCYGICTGQYWDSFLYISSISPSLFYVRTTSIGKFVLSFVCL